MFNRREFLAASGGILAGATGRTNAARAAEAPTAESMVSAAEGVVQRVFGETAGNLSLEWSPAAADGHDVFEVSASNGRARIAGSSAVALCRGLYTYLRKSCGVMVTWSGYSRHVPKKWPDHPTERTVCPYRFTQYLNPCTFGYSTAFWPWERWERELDWMALHGINMPLAMVGQEAIWQRIWTTFGVTQAEWDRFTTSPAHLPWHRMGNINRFDGPLQGYVDGTRELQKKIVARMFELGMTPIAPGFAGHVPEAFLRVFPQAETFTLLWSGDSSRGLPRLTKTFLLHPREAELYREIGGRFIEEYRKEFGPVNYYLADSFNELKVPVSDQNRYGDLKQFAANIYGGIQAGDPMGIWVMQGWAFSSAPKFWDLPSTEAFLSGAPQDKLLIIDYSADLDSVHVQQYGQKGDGWSRLNAFFGKQWINGMAHTFGGNDNVKGNLPLIASKPAETLANPGRGRLVGWGLDMEGIESNEAVYELLTDAGWSSRPIRLNEWIPSYAKARYGGYPEAMAGAWKLLLASAYGADVYKTKHAFQSRPSLSPKPQYVDTGADFQKAVQLFLGCADELSGSPLYRNDAIEFVTQAAGGNVDAWLAKACGAHARSDGAVRDHWAEEAHAMLLRLDGLMNLRPERRLETWVLRARSWAGADGEAAYYDGTARLLITYWGWAELEDYASRLWSGLIRDYYAARWRVFFHGLAAEGEFSMDDWEQAWLSRPYQPTAPKPVPDMIAEARQILADCARINSQAI